jgi:peptide/nickel transport system substrate-binding protein
MILAVDRDLLIESLWHGRSVSTGYQTPAYGALYDPARPKPAYDLERARALVAQSSYRGERIALRTTGSYYVAELATTQALIEMWRAAGITVAIEAVENYAQWYQRPGSGLYNYSSVMVYPDPLSDVARNFGPSSQLQTIEDSWGNEEFNRLCGALASTLDQAERRRIFARMLDIMDWEDPPAVPLFMQSMFYGLRADIDWTPYPAHQMDFGPGSIRLGAAR